MAKRDVVRVRRPKTKTKKCAHCKRLLPRLKIEWHPGILEWQCSNFDDCDKVITRNEEGALPKIPTVSRRLLTDLQWAAQEDSEYLLSARECKVLVAVLGARPQKEAA